MYALYSSITISLCRFNVRFGKFSMEINTENIDGILSNFVKVRLPRDTPVNVQPNDGYHWIMNHRLRTGH